VFKKDAGLTRLNPNGAYRKKIGFIFITEQNENKTYRLCALRGVIIFSSSPI